MNLLTLQNVTKSYKPNEPPAVNDLSFNCKSSEVIALIGGSGSGKTTLLRIIAGLEAPDYGEVILNKNTLNSSTVFVAPEKRDCGLVFQDYALFPNKTVRQNILFGKGAMDDPSWINELIDMTGIAGLEQRFPHELSGGQQQRVALVRALATRPLLLLLDEPLSHLDPELKESVRTELLKLFSKTKTTVVFVSHDIEDATAMADRMVVIHKGKAEQIGTSDEIYRNPMNKNVARLFGKTNFIPIELIPNAPYSFTEKESNEKIVPVRPHQWHVINDSITDLPIFNGKVKSVINQGSYKEVEFETSQISLILHLPKNQSVQADSKLTIAYNAEL
jgi:iron(III) transport system ATP-binding protein